MLADEWGITHTETSIPEYMPPKETSMWSVMNASIDKKIKPPQKEKEKISEFMFHKLLARFENTLDFALMFTTKTIPVDKQWDIIRNMVSKSFIPFEKGKKKFESGSIDNVMRYYRCNESTALEYIEMMPEIEIERINKKYSKGKV